jgi:hypothetical protein
MYLNPLFTDRNDARYHLWGTFWHLYKLNRAVNNAAGWEFLHTCVRKTTQHPLRTKKKQGQKDRLWLTTFAISKTSKQMSVSWDAEVCLMMSTAAVKAQMCCRCGPDTDIVGSNLDQDVKVCVFDSGLSRPGRGLATGHSLVQGFSPRFRTQKTGGPELHWHVVSYRQKGERCSRSRPEQHSPNSSKINTLNKTQWFLRSTI